MPGWWRRLLGAPAPGRTPTGHEWRVSEAAGLGQACEEAAAVLAMLRTGHGGTVRYVAMSNARSPEITVELAAPLDAMARDAARRRVAGTACGLAVDPDGLWCRDCRFAVAWTGAPVPLPAPGGGWAP